MLDKKRIDFVINQVEANLNFEGMEMSEEGKVSITKCLTGESSFEQEIEKLNKKYR